MDLIDDNVVEMFGFKASVDIILGHGNFTRNVEDQVAVVDQGTYIGTQAAAHDQGLLRIQFKRVDILSFVFGRIDVTRMAIGVRVAVFVIEDVPT